MSTAAPSSLASASPGSSSRQESNNNSPQLTSSDLGLDPSDPLNLLLHNSSQNSDSSMDDSSAGGSPPDWLELPSLWPSTFDNGGLGGDGKDYSDMMDLNMPLATELDFGSSMVVDPNVLHFDNQRLDYSYDDLLSNNLFSGQTFPFSFDSSMSLDPNSQQQRRLSVTSESSSSGTSLSSIVEALSTPTQNQPPLHDQQPSNSISQEDFVDEIAQRVRQSAGVMLAVPMGAHISSAGTAQNLSVFSSPNLSHSSPASSPISIPGRSPDSHQSSGSSVSSAASTPPPKTPPPSNGNSTLDLNAAVSESNPYPGGGSSMGMGMIPRPKTSHTTIERRYRTNLNARIMSLRMAVPALRVLENKEGCGVGGGGKKVKGKNATLGRNVPFGTKIKKEGEDGEEVVDIIDERGFVDGVKVARKCSKANVLGKAVEYIRVLKKREHRLKREQEGLKSLISGLVGGPALLREWEREWRAKFGGEEKDEVEGEEIDDGGSDDEGSGDEDDADDENTRKRKRAKVAISSKKEPKEAKAPPPPVQAQVLPDGTVVVPEKRKRGRPRKVVPPPATVQSTGDQPTAAVKSESPAQAQQPQHGQYLLAAFALFSFFNSPFSSSSSPSHPPPNHSHTGTVLSHSQPYHVGAQPTALGWTWHEIIQAFHLMVSLLVFVSIVTPWLPTPSKYFSLSYLSSSRKPRTSRITATKAPRSRSASLVAALSIGKRGSEDEAADLRDALDGHLGFRATVKSLLGRSKRNVGFEQKGLEQRAWVRLGEICVLKGQTFVISRALTWWHMRSHLSWFTSSAADLSTLSLVLWPLGRFARRHARATWDAARARKGCSGGREVGIQVRPHERLVLESMSVDEAVEHLGTRSPDVKQGEWDRYPPIGVLACMLVRKRLRQHLEVMFINTVLPNERGYELEDDGDVDAVDAKAHVEEEEKEDEERRKTIDAARSLGGKMAELGDALQKIWTMGIWELDGLVSPQIDADEDEEEVDGERDLENEIRVLLDALVLYRQIFSSSISGSMSNRHGAGVSILLSPPPSPSRQDEKLHYALRRVLGSTVFESENEQLGGALEDARDRVVDMLVECERAGRST